MKKNYGQTILIRQRMLKVKQRELILSHIRQHYCTSGQSWKPDVSSSIIFKQVESIISNQHDHDSGTQESTQVNIIQSEPQKSREFIKRLNKITKDSYGKRRKNPPLDKLCDLSMYAASLDMEWNDFDTVLKTLVYFRKLLYVERNPPIDEVILSGAVPYLLQYLDLERVRKFFIIDQLDDSGKQLISLSHLHRLQFEATWSITNIASGNQDHTRYIVDLDCIPGLINLMDSESDDVKQSIWALGNISGDSVEMRDLVLYHGAMPKLIKILESGEARFTLTRTSVKTLANLLRGKPLVPWEIVSTSLPVLKNLLYSLDTEILLDTCWAISYACGDGPDETIEAIINHNIITRVIQLLQFSDFHNPVLRILGSISCGTDVQTLKVLNCGILFELNRLLDYPKNIRKQVLWILSNISAGNTDQIQMVIESGIIPKVISILLSGSEIEGYWVLSNLCGAANKEQIKHLIGKGIVQQFCVGLKLKDTKIIVVALEGLSNCVISSAKEQNIHEIILSDLKEYGGLDRILELKNNEDKFIKDISIQILEKFK